jgi:hypothetical protein
MLSKYVKFRIYNTIILPVVLYGCKTWSLTLREEHGLRMFGNRVLRRTFGLKREEVEGMESLNSSVGIVAGYGLDVHSLIPRKRVFLCFTVSRPAMGLTHPPVQ